MYGDSQALSSDPISIFTSTPRHKEELLNIPLSKELFMDSSDTSFSDYSKKYTNNNQNNSPGLLRFRSAPSSLFTDVEEKDISAKNSTGATQGLTSLFSSGGGAANNGNLHQVSHHLHADQAVVNTNTNNNGCYAMNLQLPPQYPRNQVGSVDGGYGNRVVSSAGTSHQGQPKMGSGLMRQNSSPAGLFSHLPTAAQNGYTTIRGAGSYGMPNSGDFSSSSSRLKGQMSLSSGLPSSLGVLSRIAEVENENGGSTGLDDGSVRNSSRDEQFSSSGYPFDSWKDSANFAGHFNGLKNDQDSSVKLFARTQSADLGDRPRMLSHHLSLPHTSAEMAAMENLLQFQDTVPCKIRAKRGCATHPRSIAERVRRTRISERMKKLQELVPSMDKQTNTADMLDLAVNYIKDLQKQYKTLSDTRASCTCYGKQKPA